MYTIAKNNIFPYADTVNLHFFSIKNFLPKGTDTEEI